MEQQATTTTRDRLRRALKLTVKDLGRGAYRVTGGTSKRGYRVVVRDGLPVCSCPDSTNRSEQTLCKHATAVAIHMAGPAGRRAAEEAAGTN